MISLCCCQPKITAALESRAHSNTKNGEAGYEGQGWFRRVTRTHNYKMSCSGGACSGKNGSHSCSITDFYRIVNQLVRVFPNTGHWEEADYASSSESTCYHGMYCGDPQPSTTYTNTQKITSSSSSGSSGGGACSQSMEDITTLSDEYTTDTLIAEIRDYIETLDWVPNPFLVIAGIHLADDEFICAISEVRFKFSADQKIPTGKKAVITYDLLTVDVDGKTQSHESREAVIDAGKTDIDWIKLPIEREKFYKLGAFTYAIKDQDA